MKEAANNSNNIIYSFDTASFNLLKVLLFGLYAANFGITFILINLKTGLSTSSCRYQSNGIINFIIIDKFLLMCREECEDTLGVIS
jgi:hypothetical protein